MTFDEDVMTEKKRPYRKPEIKRVSLADTGTMALVGCKANGVPPDGKNQTPGCKTPSCQQTLAS